MPPVFLSSVGVASPIGWELDEVLDALESGTIAVGPLKRIDGSRLRTGVGGEVQLSKLVTALGFASLAVPFFQEPLNLEDNPKLTFALWACAKALGIDPRTLESSSGVRPTDQSSIGLTDPSTIRPADQSSIALFTTAGLEEVNLQALWSPSSKNNHLCREIPPSFIGEVLCWVFGFNEIPPVSIASACASSTQSIGEAYRAIRDGRISRALAGGTDSMLYPYGINAFNSLGALAEGQDSDVCIRPFDEERKGTLLGEGAAYFLLESEEALRNRGGKAMCELLGYGSSLDAYHPVKPHPEGDGAMRALRNALNDANLSPNDIDYVNAHGSGTFHNDVAEIRALRKVFKDHPVQVSSTKPCYGHLLTAGGAIEAISLLCALKRQVAPPTSTLRTVDEDCIFDYLPTTSQPGHFRHVVSNSFGLHGQNGVLIMKALQQKALQNE